MEADEMKKRLLEKFEVSFLEVRDDSRNHRGHANYTGDSGTHFSVVLVSPEFSGVPLVDRHRRVYEALENEMKRSLHALALSLHTPEEWERKHGISFQ